MIHLDSCTVRPGPIKGTAIVVDAKGRTILTISEVSDDNMVNLFLQAERGKWCESSM